MIDLEAMYHAYIECRKKKSRKSGTKKFETNALYNIQRLTDEINSRKYKVQSSQCFIIKYPTTREVFCASFRDRVVQHFIYLELNPFIDKKLIYDSANCRLNKGTDFAIRRVQTFLRRETNNYTEESFFLKLDLSGFFMSIDKNRVCNLLLDVLENDYTGPYKEDLRYLIPIVVLNDPTINAIKLCKKDNWDNLPSYKTLFNNETGLPIGNICSQLAANLYLNDFDYYLKSQHKSVSRYVDDVIVLDKDIQKLQQTLSYVQQYLATINLRINSRKTYIKNCKYGIPYLGILIKPHYSIMAATRINRLYFTSRNLTENDYFNRCASRRGMFIHYHGYNIGRKWFNSLPAFVHEKSYLDSNSKICLKNKPDKNKLTRLIDI